MKNTVSSLLTLSLVLLLTACSGAQPKETESSLNPGEKETEVPTSEESEQGEIRFFYVPGKYNITGGACAQRMIPEKMEDMENRTRSYGEQYEELEGLIIQCYVSGPSINRMTEPAPEDWKPGVIYRSNHVLTPITVEKVLFAEEDNPVRENDTILIDEPFYYFNEKGGMYADSAEPDSIYLMEMGAYTPLQSGYRYLIYVIYHKDEDYNLYEGQTVVNTMGLQEAVYCLGDEETAHKAVDSKSSVYWGIWKEVVEKYTNEILQENSDPVIPSLEDILEMNEEDALYLLRDCTWPELRQKWGVNNWEYSGRCGGCWISGTKQIIIDFDPNNELKPSEVSIGRVPTEEELREMSFKSTITAIVNNSQWVEDMKDRILNSEYTQGEQGCRINSIRVFGDEGEISSGKLRAESERTVIVCYDDDKELVISVPLLKYYGDYIVVDDYVLNLPDGCCQGADFEEYSSGIYCYNDHIKVQDKTVIKNGKIKRVLLFDLNNDNRREILAVTVCDDGKEKLVVYDHNSGSIYECSSADGVLTDYRFDYNFDSAYLFNSITGEKIEITMSMLKDQSILSGM